MDKSKIINLIYKILFIVMFTYIIVGGIVYTILEAMSSDDKIQKIFIDSVSIGAICFCSILLILALTSSIYKLITVMKQKKIDRINNNEELTKE